MTVAQQRRHNLRRDSGRGRGVAAAIEAYFAAAWFGWAMAAATPLLDRALQVGLALAALTLLLGVVMAVRSPGSSTPMRDRGVRRRYGIAVAAEFALIGAGSAALAATGLGRWVPVWVCAGVGVHFFPLARILREPELTALGAAITVVAAAALVGGLGTSIEPGTITGAGAGACLLLAAAATLRGRRRR